jgi:hypothetical protein
MMMFIAGMLPGALASGCNQYLDELASLLVRNQSAALE